MEKLLKNITAGLQYFLTAVGLVFLAIVTGIAVGFAIAITEHMLQKLGL